VTNQESTEQLEALIRESGRIWEQKADFWDEKMGEGNLFHRHLVAPALERLLSPQPDEQILDLACGNGLVARRLAALGAQVVAIDVSERFLQRARARTTQHAERIDYRQIDATDEPRLLTLGRRRFDAAVCTMALMDLPTIQPLLSAVSHLLKRGGRFVFAVPHPCFNSSGVSMLAEQEDRAGELRTTYALKVSDYLDVPAQKGMGMPGEPVPHYYFHRPLSVLLTACFAAGLVLDGLEEPSFPPSVSSNACLSWTSFHHIPPVLLARLRLLGTESPAH
jgi:2-polyprenyl-3-methyl-5-hydroxy-6-metoxy-1,4-benzoquinol methylase